MVITNQYDNDKSWPLGTNDHTDEISLIMPIEADLYEADYIADFQNVYELMQSLHVLFILFHFNASIESVLSTLSDRQRL